MALGLVNDVENCKLNITSLPSMSMYHGASPTPITSTPMDPGSSSAPTSPNPTASTPSMVMDPHPSSAPASPTPIASTTSMAMDPGQSSAQTTSSTPLVITMDHGPSPSTGKTRVKRVQLKQIQI